MRWRSYPCRFLENAGRKLARQETAAKFAILKMKLRMPFSEVLMLTYLCNWPIMGTPTVWDPQLRIVSLSRDKYVLACSPIDLILSGLEAV